MRTSACFALLTMILCSLANAQQSLPPVVAPGPAAADPQAANKDLLKMYRLKYTKSESALETIKRLGFQGQFADDSRTNSLVISASPSVHKEIAELLTEIDEQETDGDVTQILLSRDVEPSETLLSKFAEMSGVQAAFDKDTGLFMIKGSKAEVEQATKFIEELRAQAQMDRDQNSLSRSYALRLLWLSNDPVEDSRNPFEPDPALKRSIQKLSELGFANMKVKMHLLGRCDMIQDLAECKISGSQPANGSSRRNMIVQGMLTGSSGMINGKLSLEVAIVDPNAESIEENSTTVEVAINLEPKKYYILAASPVGGYQSAFVVQLIDDLQ